MVTIIDAGQTKAVRDYIVAKDYVIKERVNAGPYTFRSPRASGMSMRYPCICISIGVCPAKRKRKDTLAFGRCPGPIGCFP